MDATNIATLKSTIGIIDELLGLVDNPTEYQEECQFVKAKLQIVIDSSKNDENEKPFVFPDDHLKMLFRSKTILCLLRDVNRFGAADETYEANFQKVIKLLTLHINELIKSEVQDINAKLPMVVQGYTTCEEIMLIYDFLVNDLASYVERIDEGKDETYTPVSRAKSFIEIIEKAKKAGLPVPYFIKSLDSLYTIAKDSGTRK